VEKSRFPSWKPALSNKATFFHLEGKWDDFFIILAGQIEGKIVASEMFYKCINNVSRGKRGGFGLVSGLNS
jgi:hypothetical protein